jgi:hypothetical protein
VMSKGPLERRERLHRACKSIIDNPRNVDDDAVAAFKKATMGFVHCQYDDPERAFKNLYESETETGRLVRKAAEVVIKRDDQEYSPLTGAVYPRSRSFLDVIDDDDGDALALARDRDPLDDDDDIEKQADHHASTVAGLLVEAGSFPHRAAALQHLLHKPSGQALLARMHKAADQTEKETPPMTSHSEFVQSVVKQYGIVALAKSMVQDQKSYGLDEHQFTQPATEHAQRVYLNDRPDVAFSKLYQSEESVRRACRVAKAQTLDVMVVGGPNATHEAINNTEQSEAYQQLVDMAEKLRAASPFLSTSQAFARASEQRPDLLAKAHKRPAATTSYEFPR